MAFGFGRRKGGNIIDFPPRKKGDGEEEPKSGAPAVEKEPIFRDHPGPLDTDSILEMAKDGDIAQITQSVDDYYDGWFRYSQDRNSGSAAKPLWEARIGVIKAAQNFFKQNEQFERDAKEAELKRTLEEFANKTSEAVQTEVERRMGEVQKHRNKDLAEHRELLKDSVNQIEEVREKPKQEPELLLTRNEDVRYLEREARADKFAEKYGLTAERAALIEAENEYADAVRNYQTKFFNFRENANTRKQQEKMDAALSAWREALSAAGKKAEADGLKQDVISARFIGARDTMTRMERVRQDAAAEGLDAQSKTLFGKIDGWANKLNKKVVEGAQHLGNKFNAGSEVVGEKVAGWILTKLNLVDKETDPEKYKRTMRVIGGTLITSAVLAPAGAIAAGGVGLGLLWRPLRGLAMGLGGGAAIGKVAGAGYDKKFGAKETRLEKHLESQKDLRDILKGKKGSFDSLDPESLRKAFKMANKESFEKSEEKHDVWKTRAEMGAAILVGGALSYEFGHGLPGSHTVETPPASTGDITHDTHAVPHHAGAHAPVVPEAAAPLPHIESVSVGGHVNDADKLFGRFMDNARHQFPDPQNAPPAIRSLLTEYNAAHDHLEAAGGHGPNPQDVLTRLLHLQNGESIVVHNGDSLSFEGGKIMLQGHVVVDESGTIHNLHGEPGVHFAGPHGAHTPHETHAAHAPSTPHETHPPAPVHANPESHTAQEPSTKPQPAPAQTPHAAQPATHATQTPPPAHEAAPQPHTAAPRPEPVPVAHVQEAPPRVVPPVEHHATQPVTPIEHHEAPPVPEHHAAAPVEQPAAQPPLEYLTQPPQIVPEHHEVHVPTPSNDNEVPSTHAPESAPGVTHNAFGLDVDSRTSHLYQLHQPGVNNPNVLVAFGGTVDERLHAAQQFLSRPENINKVVFITGSQPDPVTGHLMTTPWRVDAATHEVRPGPVFTTPDGLVPPPPGPNDLQTIIQ